MKDEQFIEEMEKIFCGVENHDCIVAIIKRSFAHRDEHWREKVSAEFDVFINREDWGKGYWLSAVTIVKENVLALFKDKENEE